MVRTYEKIDSTYTFASACSWEFSEGTEIVVVLGREKFCTGHCEECIADREW